ncbi:MAG: hypothetical protein GOVbin2669_10 [Prokaryotic dsDNA virus sp.]|nr:MAG: hypothetical protein GOVbin2669_10 [Prokaryotic dsDNA virus sp.]
MPLKTATKDTAETILVNSSVIGFTTFAEIEMVLKILLLVLTIGYTVNRWYTHYKKNK